MHVAGVDIWKWEMGFDLEDREKVNGSCKVVTEWLIAWVTTRERLCNSCSWATDSREQCNLEKYRTWNDPGQVTWLQEEMTDTRSWWSNGNKGCTGKEQLAEAPRGANQKWLRLGMNLVHTQEGRRGIIFPGLSWYSSNLLTYGLTWRLRNSA